MGRSGFSKPMVTGVALVLLSVALLTLPVVNAQALMWTNVTSPTSVQLNSVYCVSSTDCWAVGKSNTIIQFTGSSWATVTSPSDPSTDFRGVFCVSASDCWAVGDNENTFAGTTIQWTGSSWGTVSNPATFPLNSVYCNSASDCWAVGADSIIIHWTGSTWGALVPAPVVNQFLAGVFCVGGTDCWAVGNGFHVSTIFHWTGSSWVNVPPPVTSPLNDNLASVFCVGAGDCWAVGIHGAIIQWTGSSWGSVSSPANSLNSVYCVNANDCWAVGTSIIQWTGSSWATVPDPASSYLNSVFIDSGWAVGYNGAIIRGDPVTPPIPEYPLGLPLLAIFTLIAYGIIKRRTQTPKNI